MSLMLRGHISPNDLASCNNNHPLRHVNLASTEMAAVRVLLAVAMAACLVHAAPNVILLLTDDQGSFDLVRARRPRCPALSPPLGLFAVASAAPSPPSPLSPLRFAPHSCPSHAPSHAQPQPISLPLPLPAPLPATSPCSPSPLRRFVPFLCPIRDRSCRPSPRSSTAALYCYPLRSFSPFRALARAFLASFAYPHRPFPAPP